MIRGAERHLTGYRYGKLLNATHFDLVWVEHLLTPEELWEMSVTTIGGTW